MEKTKKEIQNLIEEKRNFVKRLEKTCERLHERYCTGSLSWNKFEKLQDANIKHQDQICTEINKLKVKLN